MTDFKHVDEALADLQGVLPVVRKASTGPHDRHRGDDAGMPVGPVPPLPRRRPPRLPLHLPRPRLGGRR